MAETFKRLNVSVPNYELEIEYGTKSTSNKKALQIIMKETQTLLKIIQQSNYIITGSMSEKIISYYKNIMMIDPKVHSTSLDGRQPITLEIQHIPEDLPNRYAVTDKADGERNFLIICDNNVYFISTNLHVTYTGIVLPKSLSEYNGSIVEPHVLQYSFTFFGILLL
jgi:hypothetical protein